MKVNFQLQAQVSILLLIIILKCQDLLFVLPDSIKSSIESMLNTCKEFAPISDFLRSDQITDSLKEEYIERFNSRLSNYQIQFQKGDSWDQVADKWNFQLGEYVYNTMRRIMSDFGEIPGNGKEKRQALDNYVNSIDNTPDHILLQLFVYFSFLSQSEKEKRAACGKFLDDLRDYLQNPTDQRKKVAIKTQENLWRSFQKGLRKNWLSYTASFLVSALLTLIAIVIFKPFCTECSIQQQQHQQTETTSSTGHNVSITRIFSLPLDIVTLTQESSISIGTLLRMSAAVFGLATLSIGFAYIWFFNDSKKNFPATTESSRKTNKSKNSSKKGVKKKSSKTTSNTTRSKTANK